MAKTNNTFQIRRRDNNNSSIIHVESGQPAKFYLEAHNPPEGYDYFYWEIRYTDHKGESRQYTKIVHKEKGILVEWPNSLVSSNLKVFLTAASYASEMLSLHGVGGSTSRRFEMATPKEIKTAHILYPENKSKRIVSPDKTYKIYARSGEFYFSIEVEGHNEQTLFAKVSCKGANMPKKSFKVYANRVLIDNVRFDYSDMQSLTEDTVTLTVWGKGLSEKTFNFQLQIDCKNPTTVEADAARQVVVVGYPSRIVPNNFHPCKFTDIHMKEIIDDRNIIVRIKDAITDFKDSFDNAWQTFEDVKYNGLRIISEADTNQIQPYQLVAGQGNKEIDLYIKDFTTQENDCENKPVHRPQISFSFENGKEKKFDVKNGLVKIDVNYPYLANVIREETGFPVKEFLPLDCLLPTLRPKRGNIRISSCRRNITIPLVVYPDIQWFIGLKCKLSKGIDKNSKEKFASIFSFSSPSKGTKNMKEAMEFDKRVMQSSFKIGLVTSWNNIEEKKAPSESSPNYAAFFIKPFEMKDARLTGSEQYLQALQSFGKNAFYNIFLDTIRIIMDVVSFIEMMKLAVSLAKTAEPDFPVNATRKDLFTFELIPPDLDLSIGWRAGSKDGKAGLVMEGKGKGNIIQIKGTLDLFCLASRIPGTKSAIIALELIEWATGTEFTFNLEFSAGWSWEGSIGYYEARNEWNNSVAIKGKIPVTLNLKMTVEPGKDYIAVTENKNEYGIKGTAGITGEFKFQYLSEKDTQATAGAGIYNKNIAKFDAITVLFYKKSTKRENGKGKNYTEPIDVKAKPITLWGGHTFIESKLTKIL